MASNNGLVTRYSKLVNLHSPTHGPRPPTLVKNDSAVVSERRKSKRRATDRYDWGPILVLAVAGLVYALIVRWME